MQQTTVTTPVGRNNGMSRPPTSEAARTFRQASIQLGEGSVAASEDGRAAGVQIALPVQARGDVGETEETARKNASSLA
jgi:hypothetical protein